MSSELMENMKICGFDNPEHENHWIFRAILNKESLMNIAEKFLIKTRESVENIDNSFGTSTTCELFYTFIQYKKSNPVEKEYRLYLSSRGGILGFDHHHDSGKMTFVKVTDIIQYYHETGFFDWLEE